MATSQDTWLESDGASVEVDILYTVPANAVAYAGGWLGISARSGDSGARVALQIDKREFQFSVPASLNPAVGQVVYINLSNVGSAHVPPDAAYTLTSGANTRALFRATSTRDTNNVVTGVLLSGTVV